MKLAKPHEITPDTAFLGKAMHVRDVVSNVAIEVFDRFKRQIAPFGGNAGDAFEGKRKSCMVRRSSPTTRRVRPRNSSGRSRINRANRAMSSIAIMGMRAATTGNVENETFRAICQPGETHCAIANADPKRAFPATGPLPRIAVLHASVMLAP